MHTTTDIVAVTNKDTPLIVLLRSGYPVFACHQDLARPTSVYRTTASCGFIGTSDHQHLVIPLDHPRKTLMTVKMQDLTSHTKRRLSLLNSANFLCLRAQSHSRAGRAAQTENRECRTKSQPVLLGFSEDQANS